MLFKRKRKARRFIRSLLFVALVLGYLALEHGPEFSLSSNPLPVVLSNDETPVENQTEQDALETTTVSSDFIRPEYSGDAFVYVNDNVPYLASEVASNVNTKYQFDKYGRPIGATVIVSSDTVTDTERDDISNIYPPGWDQEKYDESIVDGGYVYNRCHLIAHSLGGPDIAENLITGTRYFNIEGMWQFEETVLYYVRDTGNPVLYRVTPVYESNELIPRGVLMEAYSMDDNGSGLSFCVYCHNVQPYINIDYNTGATSLQMN